MEKFDTLYLHIGTRKTGTTVLQRFCYDNKDVLQKNGLLYPTSDIALKRGTSNHHKIINTKKYNFIKLREALLKEKAETNKCLISSELLEEVGREPDRLKDLFSLAKEIKVIVYLKRQDAYLESSYGQKIKRKRCVLDIYEHEKEIVLDYRILINYWSSLVGRENIIVRSYEKKQFKNGNIFDDFLNIFNMSLADGFKVLKSFRNPSLERVALEFKRLTNYLELPRELSMRLARILEARAGDLSKTSVVAKSGILSMHKRLQYIKHYETSNNEIAKEFLGKKTLFSEVVTEELNSNDEDGFSEKEWGDIVQYLAIKAPELLSVLVYSINVYIKLSTQEGDELGKMKLILRLVSLLDKESVPPVSLYIRSLMYLRMKRKK